MLSQERHHVTQPERSPYLSAPSCLLCLLCLLRLLLLLLQLPLLASDAYIPI